MTDPYSSPLRYPGGKGRLFPVLEELVLFNNLEKSKVYELYAGGAGASLSLLFSGNCSEININDLDPHIFAFWQAVLRETDKFVKKISEISVDINSWNEQSKIYNNYSEYSPLEVGFATFFLNRCNRSGIIHKAGPIGGFNQTGKYKIDVRFNKRNLITRIEKIGSYSNKINLTSVDGIELLKKIDKEDVASLIFLDPPYYTQGENLYLNAYEHQDHLTLSEELANAKNCNWVLTYDNHDTLRQMYSGMRLGELDMSYTLQQKRKTKEIIVFSESLFLPEKFTQQFNLRPNDYTRKN